MNTSRSGQTTVGFDVGGTHLRAIVVDEQGEVVAQVRQRSRQGDAAGIAHAIAALADDLAPQAPVGIGIAGLVTGQGVVVASPNLGLRGYPMAAQVAMMLGRDVTVINDATAAAYAEHAQGAGSGCANLVLVTIGTGIGAGLIIDNVAVKGSSGFAGEVGHVVVDSHGPVCACGQRGCLEALSSGSAIARQGNRMQLDGTREVIAAALRGDQAATAVLDTAGRALGQVLATVVTVTDPELIVIGGGAGQALLPWYAAAIEQCLREMVFAADLRTLPAVVPARLGDDAGAIGAALLAV